jgi:DNA polymerase-1
VNTCFIDFEYNSEAGITICCVIRKCRGGTVEQEWRLDLRERRDLPVLQQIVADHPDHVWIAYSATAEIHQLLNLGIEVRQMKWIDALVEARMISATLPEMQVPSRYADAHNVKLAHQLRAFGVADVDDRHKEEMQKLCYTRTEWTDEEFAAILEYCAEDVAVLLPLMKAIVQVHVDKETCFRLEHAIERGRYVMAVAILENRSKGFPIDVEWLNHIFENRHLVAAKIAEDCNEQLGREIYRRPKVRKDMPPELLARVPYTRSMLEITRLIADSGMDWERTPSGQYRLDEDYLGKQCRLNQNLMPLKTAIDSLNALKSADLRELLTPDGYIKADWFPYGGKTGRNQPRPSKGFVLNLPPWLRSVIRPHPGRVFIGRDWSKQEIAVGASLSDDRNLRAAFQAKDIYLELAKMAGAVPPDADKESHPDMRQTFKSVQLAIGYGMGLGSLGTTVFGNSKGAFTLDQSKALAKEIARWHKSYFSDYWEALEVNMMTARARGWYTVMDGWMRFVGPDDPATELLNFPIQSVAAMMMRRATIIFAFETGLDIAASHHDAFYANAAASDTEAVKAEMGRVMDRAAEDVLSRLRGGYIPIPAEPKTYTHEEPWVDKRGVKMVELIRSM